MLVLGQGMGFTSWASDMGLGRYIPNQALDANYFTLPWTTVGGSTYNETLTDTAVTVDSLTVTANFVSSVTDVGVLVEQLTHAMNMVTSLTDTLISSDSLVHTTSVSDTLTDIGIFVDSATDGFLFSENVSDTIVSVDLVTQSMAFDQAFTDVGVLSDSTTQTLDQFVTNTDILVSADSLLESLGISLTLTDTAVFVDEVLAGFVFTENVTDVGVLSDTITPSLVISDTITDSATMVDIATHIQDMLNTIQDLGITSDQLTHIQGMVSSVTEVGVFTDSNTHTATVSDTLTDTGVLSDSTTQSVTFGVTLQDLIVASDIVENYMNMVSTVNDTIVGVDSLTHSQVFETLISDTGILVDVLTETQAFSSIVQDVGVITDTLTASMSLSVSPTDILAAVDSTTATMDFVEILVDIGVFVDAVQTQNPVYFTETIAAISSSSTHLSRTSVFGTTVNLNSTFDAALKILKDFSIISAIQSACFGTVRLATTVDTGVLMPFNQQIAVSFPFTDINTIRGLVSNHPWVQRLNGSSSSFTFSRASRAALFDYEFIEQKVHWYDAGEARVRNSGLLLEKECWNECLWSRDFSNAVWVKSNVTVVANGLGADEDITKGFTMTATAANGTIMQTVSGLTIGNYCGHIFMKRMNGVGPIYITVDGGLTWKNVTADDGSLPENWYTRVSTSIESVTSVTLGVKIATIGDSIAIDFAQIESGLYHMSPIETTTARAFRAGDNLSISTIGWPTAQGSVQFQLKTEFENDPDEAPGGPMPVIDSRTAGPVNGLYITADHGLISIDIFNNGDTINVTGPVIWSDDHHNTIKFSWGGGFLKLYVNGVLVESLVDSHNIGGHAAQAIIGPCDAFIKNLEFYQS